MLTVRLPEKLEERLSELSAQTHRSKSYYVKQALEIFLDEHEDHLLALFRFEKKNPRLTFKEMEHNLDLKD